MRKIPWFWVGIGSLITIVFIISWQQFGKLTPSADILTEQEAKSLVQDRYQGNVGQVKLTDRQYHVELEKQNRLYTIKIDAETGKVIGFTETKTLTQSQPPSPPPGEQSSEEVEENIPAPAKSLTDSEAIEIALTQVQGEVDDVRIETKDDISYFLVEIETEDDREATVEIHSITGEVMSFTFNDRKHKDDDDDDRNDDD